VIQILRPRDQPLDFVWAEDDWQAESLLGIRQGLAHIAPLQHIAAEEPECADLGDDGRHGEPSLFEQIQVIAPELRWRDPFEARSGVLAKRLNDLDAAADGRSGVVATYQLVAGIAVVWSQTPPVTTHPILLRMTRLPVGRRASGFVQVAKGGANGRRSGVYRD
jgi:hypothetical protein